MCCCCFGCCFFLERCWRVNKPYPQPRYRYRCVSAVEWGLLAVLVALLLGLPLLTRTPYAVRSLGVKDRLVLEVATRIEKSADARSGLGTDKFTRVGSDAAPIDPAHNDLARAQLDDILADVDDAADVDVDVSQVRVRSDLYSVEDVYVPTPNGEVTVRVYTPLMRCSAQMPVVVLLHGGGFVFGSSSDTTSSFVASTVLSKTGAVVVSVEYRLAPEHPCPAAVNDTAAVIEWVLSGQLGEHTNTSHVVALGIEAGGNLAAVAAAMLARKNTAQPLFGLVCVHPWFLRHDTSSRARFKDTTMLYGARLDWLESLYNPEGACRPELVDPTLAEGGLEGMPPTHVFTCGVCR